MILDDRSPIRFFMDFFGPIAYDHVQSPGSEGL